MVLLIGCVDDPEGPPRNNPPVFPANFPEMHDSLAMLDSATVGYAYLDTAGATDPDGDALEFDLVQGPGTATLTGQGIITWVPTVADTGVRSFHLRVRDEQNACDTLVWTVTVSDTNHWAVFDTAGRNTPDSILVGHEYRDTLRVSDHDGDILTFALADSVASMGLSDSVIEWTPTVDDTGRHLVSVTVCDGHGPCDSLSWTIVVSDTNHAPAIVTTPDSMTAVVRAGQIVQDTVSTFDPDGDSLTFHVTDTTAPLTIRDSVVTWMPEVSDTGVCTVTVVVEDPEGATDSISWVVTVLDSNHGPVIESTAEEMGARVYTLAEYRDTICARDPDGDSLTITLTTGPSGMNMSDSVIAWTPAKGDTGVHTITVHVADLEVCDSLTWEIAVRDTNYPPRFTSTEKEMTDTIMVGDEYVRTLTATDPDGDPVTFVFIDSGWAMQLADSVISWTPRLPDAGTNKVRVICRDNMFAWDTLTWHVVVLSPPLNCPSYTHEDDAAIGDRADLPGGYFVYNISGATGLYISYISDFSLCVVPNTRGDRVACPSISDNGNWLLYVDSYLRLYLIRCDGRYKTAVPVGEVSFNYPRVARFLRNGPNGEEVVYFTNRLTVRAVEVNFQPDTVTFGATRTLIDLSGAGPSWSIVADPIVDFAVSGDQVFGRFDNRVAGSYCSRTEFLTIPNNGAGVGTAADIYQWKNDDYRRVDGCGHAMSHDGTLTVSNPPFLAGTLCVPRSHTGVAITPFRRVTDAPIDFYDEHFDKYGTSLNFCPQQYRNEADFWGWYFGNSNDYIIGRQYHEGSSGNGVWILEWQTNTWTRLTPDDLPLDAIQSAVHFGDINIGNPDSVGHALPDTTLVDPFDPQYRVVSPNGAETFMIGEICTVVVSASLDGNATLAIEVQGGRYSTSLPGVTGSFNPMQEALFTFSILDSFYTEVFNSGTGEVEEIRVSFVSDSCRIVIQDYNLANQYQDESDDYFHIRNP